MWEAPPPTAGIVALMALNILTAHDQQQQQQQANGSSSSSSRSSASELHLAIEACRLAFADALAKVSAFQCCVRVFALCLCPQVVLLAGFFLASFLSYLVVQLAASELVTLRHNVAALSTLLPFRIVCCEAKSHTCLTPVHVHTHAPLLTQVSDPVVQRELPLEALLSQQRAVQRYEQYFDPQKVRESETQGFLW